jgi:hypothetical protein
MMTAKQVGPRGSKPETYHVFQEQTGDEAFLSGFHQSQQVVVTASKAGYKTAARSWSPTLYIVCSTGDVHI